MSELSFPIRAFVGPNGGGKTLAMVEEMALPAWRAGRPTVTNLVLRPEVLGFDRSLYVPLTSWRMIPDLDGCALLLDEITSVLPSRQAMSLPPQLASVLNQMRKPDIKLGWTAPNWARSDVLLREVTQAVTVCRGYVPDRWRRMWLIEDPWKEAGRPRPRLHRFPLSGPVVTVDGKRQRFAEGWGPNRLFKWTTYDAQEFDEFTYSAVRDVRPRRRRFYWRPAHYAHRVYDTLQAVALLDHLDDVGACVVCGGARSRPKCSCTRPERVPVARQGVSPEGAGLDLPQAGPFLDTRAPWGPVDQAGSRAASS